MTDCVSGLGEILLGGGLMALGVLMLIWWLLPRGLWRRFDVLALLLAVLALAQAQKRRPGDTLIP